MPLDQIKNNPEMNAYFQSLPKMLQETIVQSGAPFGSLQELKQFVETMDAR